jgi:hypothetical protein
MPWILLFLLTQPVFGKVHMRDGQYTGVSSGFIGIKTETPHDGE